MIDTILNQYQVIDHIGEGGMGVVYLAEDRRLQRKVALKFVSGVSFDSTQELARFNREAQAAARLNHPNICTIYELGEAEGKTYIAMEYVEGITLKERIRQGNIKMEDISGWLKQIAEGLQAAHEEGVVHRDIKPANIILNEKGPIKIMDFGIAKLTESQTELTQANSTIGTISYMSPEQAKGEVVDQRTDIWSLGVILYEMTTGQRPFSGAFREAVMYAMMHTDLPAASTINPDIPESLNAIINRCLQRNREERYASLEHLLSDMSGAPARVIHKSPQPTIINTNLGRMVVGGAMIFIMALFLLNRFSAQEKLGSLPLAMHLAVLPFDIVGDNSEDRAFSDGIAHLVAANLTQIEQDQSEMWVVPVREVIGREITSASEARQSFGIKLAVSGTVVRTAGATRITFDLTDAETLRVLRSEQLEYSELDAFELQDEVMNHLASLLDLKVTNATQQRLLAGSTKDPEAYKYYLQGQGYMQRYEIPENLDNAIQLFGRALEKDSLYALAHAGMAQAYARKYRLSKDLSWVDLARESSQRAINLTDTAAVVWNAVGHIYSLTGRDEEAILAFKTASEIEPGNYTAFRELCGKTKDFEEAVAYCNKAIQIKPDYWDGYNLLGIIYFREGELEAALDMFLDVTELTPDNSYGFNNVGTMYSRLGDKEKARDYYLQAIDIQPRANFYENVGLIYFNNRDFENAVAMFEKAVETAPLEHDGWKYLGDGEFWAGNEDAARMHWERSNELAEDHIDNVNPNDLTMLLLLVGNYAKLEEIERARSYFERVLAINPQDPTTLFDISEAYEFLKDREQAIEFLEKALNGGYPVSSIRDSPWQEDLQRDARYLELVENYR